MSLSECNTCYGVRRCECGQEDECQRFIRQAAIAFLASAPPAVQFTCDDAWIQAQKLWDAKPRDC